jgi:hypothetical protein
VIVLALGRTKIARRTRISRKIQTMMMLLRNMTRMPRGANPKERVRPVLPIVTRWMSMMTTTRKKRKDLQKSQRRRDYYLVFGLRSIYFSIERL